MYEYQFTQINTHLLLLHMQTTLAQRKFLRVHPGRWFGASLRFCGFLSSYGSNSFVCCCVFFVFHCFFFTENAWTPLEPICLYFINFLFSQSHRIVIISFDLSKPTIHHFVHFKILRYTYLLLSNLYFFCGGGRGKGFGRHHCLIYIFKSYFPISITSFILQFLPTFVKTLTFFVFFRGGGGDIFLEDEPMSLSLIIIIILHSLLTLYWCFYHGAGQSSSENKIL